MVIGLGFNCSEIKLFFSFLYLSLLVLYLLWCSIQDAMEKAIKNKVAKAVVPAIDVMYQALRFVSKIS